MLVSISFSVSALWLIVCSWQTSDSLQIYFSFFLFFTLQLSSPSPPPPDQPGSVSEEQVGDERSALVATWLRASVLTLMGVNNPHRLVLLPGMTGGNDWIVINANSGSAFLISEVPNEKHSEMSPSSVSFDCTQNLFPCSYEGGSGRRPVKLNFSAYILFYFLKAKKERKSSWYLLRCHFFFCHLSLIKPK